MMRKQIVIIDYGAGNTQSVQWMFEKLNTSTILTKDPDIIYNADKVFLPGVGAAKQAMDALQKNNIIDAIQKRKKPLMGICLGMQLLGSYSQENNNTPCLNIIPYYTQKFNQNVKVPHMGWNKVFWKKNSIVGFDEPSWMYFANSYYVNKNEYTIATCQYGQIEFSAAVQYNHIIGCQFHPEKSSFTGEKILKQFIDL